MKNFVQQGFTIPLTAPYALASGGGFQVGQFFAVAEDATAVGLTVQGMVSGVFDLAKDNSVFNMGDPVFWNNSSQLVTAVNTGTTIIGIATQNQLSTDALCRVKLTPLAMGGNGIKQTSFTLTAAQLIAMNGAPIPVIPAGGPNTVVVVENIVFEMLGTSTQFTGGGNVSFNYHGTGTNSVTGTVPAGTVTGAPGALPTLLGPAVLSTGTQVPINTGVDISNATAAFAAGTGTAKVQAIYRVVSL